MLRKTDRGENFAHYENDSMIILTREKNLSLTRMSTLAYEWNVQRMFIR